MAVLTDGQKFGLSSKSQTNKSVLYVKLTDSALRSLEEYLKNKVSQIYMRKYFPKAQKQSKYIGDGDDHGDA